MQLNLDVGGRSSYGDTQVLGWYASIRVDGNTFQLLGDANLANTTSATQKSFTFTPTRSSYLLQAGKVNVNMSFLSPIEVRVI